MIVGYARTSTLEQVAGFEAQLRELASVGAEKVFQEQVSSVAARAQLGAALDFVREGDIYGDRQDAADDARGNRRVRAVDDVGTPAGGDREGQERGQVQGTCADSPR